MRIYREKDLEANVLAGARIAIVGYGNQGHAHALNLRDSGADVIVGAREGGRGWRQASEDGFDPVGVAEATGSTDHVVVLLPDEVQARVFREDIRPHLRAGSSLVFAHGFTIAFGRVEPPRGHDVLLVAPKGQGHYLRRLFERDQGLPCLIATEVDASGTAKAKAMSYAHMLGCLRAGAIETTFREEAITDLFGEQVVLCGGVPGLVKAAFDTLVAAGYDPQVAYLECLHELKIITDLMHAGGIASMRGKISRTAAWGSAVTEAKVVSQGVRDEMRSVLESIESGEFAEGWLKEAAVGGVRLRAWAEKEARHAIESAGRSVRSLMPYLNDKEDA